MESVIARATISSWVQLAELAQACADRTWIFRGETRTDNELKPVVEGFHMSRMHPVRFLTHWRTKNELLSIFNNRLALI